MAGMAAAAQPGIRRHNAVRLTLQNNGVGGSSDKVGPPVGQGAGDAAVRGATVPAPTGGGTNTAAPNDNSQRRVTGMTRLEFSRAVLQRAMGFVPGDLNCLVKVPGNADIFDVSFKNANVLERFWNLYREGKDRPPLSNFQVEPLSDTESKVVTVQFYNETVQDYDVSTWLGRYGEVKSGARRVLDEDGVWTGARKWLVQLKPDPLAVGGVCHIPSSITLGRHRGVVFYHGMPKLCRNCGELGHLAAACTVVKCKTCGGEHETRACRDPRPCNLCGVRGHLFRDCPLSYANRARNIAPPPPASTAPPNPPQPRPTSPPPPTPPSSQPIPRPRTRPPTPPPSQPDSLLPAAQDTSSPPSHSTLIGTPNTTTSPVSQNPTTTVKEEPDSDTPVTVEVSDSSSTDSEQDSITPWQKIKRKRSKRNRSPTTVNTQTQPSQPPNPAITRHQIHAKKHKTQPNTNQNSNPTERPDPPLRPTKPLPPPVHHKEHLKTPITFHPRPTRDQPATGPDSVKGTATPPSSRDTPGTGGGPGVKTAAPTSSGRNLPGSQEGRPMGTHGRGVSRQHNNPDIIFAKINQICHTMVHPGPPDTPI